MRAWLSLCSVPLALACTGGFEASKEDAGAPDVAPMGALSWPDFPAERDVAILLPLEEDALIPANTTLPGGATALPQAWVRSVSDAYLPTVVEDGFGDESWYEDWRLVSVRVSPCAPVGSSPALAPASVCWPIVRLVWQPVVNFMDRGGVQIDAWADDRAIHALYPVQPRDTSGRRVDTTARDRVTGALERGASIDDVSPAELAAFEDSRDRTTEWLLTSLAALRDPALPAGSWSGIDDRPELFGSANRRATFQGRLLSLLGKTATPQDLRELTAFSLPAGRNPSGDDSWVFLQFTSDGSGLRQKSLEVVSRRSGELLLDYGLDQDAGQTRESPAVTEALDADPYGELHETVVEGSDDVGPIAELIADPAQVFVQNTTCATCHRLNGLRFDFHSLSHFEDRAHTVSPRVVADVARDLAWSEAWLSGSSWIEDGPAVDDGAGEDDTDTPPVLWEPNEDPRDAIEVVPPMAAALEIVEGDEDWFFVDLEAPRVVTVRINFDHSVGDLDLMQADEAGETLAWSASANDVEQLSAELPAGRSWFRVYGYNGAVAPYQLTVE